MADVTRILSGVEQGDPHAAEELLPLIYQELRQLASQKLANEKPGQTLNPTALVHEAYLRLIPHGSAAAKSGQHWDGRGHFFAAAAEAMRRILVENARRKRRLKHGGGMHRLDVDVDAIPGESLDADVLALDEALTRLAAEDPAKAKLVQLRFFAGLSNDEAASILGIASVTAKRHWRYARAWLHREVGSDDSATKL